MNGKDPSNPNQHALNWRHLNDNKLYHDNSYALRSLKEGMSLRDEQFDYKIPLDSKITYHCYWYGKVGRKHAFSIKSFLCTQDISKCQVILWVDINNDVENFNNHPFFGPLMPYIQIRVYDPVLEAKDTVWENYIELPNDQSSLPHRADAFRFLILYKYGGVYFDLDMMFLKDLGDLRNIEFCYTWETQPFANSAIISLQARSKIASYLMIKSLIKKVALPWEILHYSDPLLSDLYVLPCSFFDPVWQYSETPEIVPLNSFEFFFEKFDLNYYNILNIVSYKEFFPGCYAFHWHNKWEKKEFSNSFFGLFEKEFDVLLFQRG